MKNTGILWLLLCVISLMSSSCISAPHTIDETRMSTQLKPCAGTLSIPVNGMIELDFKTKKELYDIRKRYVSQHPELAINDYVPSRMVFGQIVDNKPWWGIKGIYIYGPGEHSIDGPSEESRFICNPFLLVGLAETNYYVMSEKRSIAPFYLLRCPLRHPVFFQDGKA